MSARGWEHLVSVVDATPQELPSLQGPDTVIQISGCSINLKHPNQLISEEFV